VGDLASHGADLTAAGAQVVLIYPGVADGLADHAKEFNSGAGLPAGFHFVTDPNMEMTAAWGLRWDEEGETAYPSAFVLDANGTVTFAKVSNSHGGRASSEEILATLKE
jgi:peroxiredoxin